MTTFISKFPSQTASMIDSQLTINGQKEVPSLLECFMPWFTYTEELLTHMAEVHHVKELIFHITDSHQMIKQVV